MVHPVVVVKAANRVDVDEDPVVAVVVDGQMQGVVDVAVVVGNKATELEVLSSPGRNLKLLTVANVD